jgi:UDP-N-acetylmuramoyl-L-alanyl-D-glutamate--2,6-diaminopimelate ligase
VGEIAYDVAVVTNITQEHLEFHGTLEAYRTAKRTLFERLAVGPANPEKGHGKHAVVNADDPSAADLETAARAAGAAVLRYGWSARGPALRSADADIVAANLREDARGMRFEVAGPGWRTAVQLRLAGRFNVHNALAALAVAEALDLDIETAAAAIGELSAVPGRMQRVDAGQPFSLVIDYAHTTASLSKVLDELAPPPSSGAGLIAVFGSAGDRDVEKRAAMGRAAGERCRLVVLTDEDPRSEDRLAILEAIARGSEAAGRVRGRDLLLIPDRAAAIHAAVARARPGDVVLLAGKGHERSIEMADGPHPWDEALAARAALEALGYGSPAG